MSKLRVDKIAAPIVQDEFTGSVYFDGSGDYLAIQDSDDFNFGDKDFTVEAWIEGANLGSRTNSVVLNQSIGGASSNSAFYFGAGNTGTSLYLSTSGSSWTDYIECATDISDNGWNHIVWQRKGNTLQIYVNGVLETVAAGSASFSGTVHNSSRIVEIGRQHTSGSQFQGYISNLRVCKGHAVYTGNFIPPTRELPVHKAPPKGVVFPAADNLTVLLACQSSTDATLDSSGRHTITANGDVHAQSANPGLLRRTLNLTTVTENTGSVYFDGVSDTLGIVENGNDFDYDADFSIEFWVYFNELKSYQDITGTSTNSAFLGSNKSGWVASYYTSGTDQFRFSYQDDSSWTFQHAFNFAASTNTWYHVAYQRNDDSIKLYVNGAQIGSTYSTSTNLISTENRLLVGSGHGVSPGSTAHFHGYLSNLRICKGHAVYTSNFAPPTRELEVHGGPDDDRTVLLACYDGENIFADKSGRHIIAAYGDRLSSPTPTSTDSPIGITTENPGLTRNVDPTAGPTFQGGAGFVSQNWLTLPKGTTTDRNRIGGRGIFAGGGSSPYTNAIEFITISSSGNSLDFGDLTQEKQSLGGTANSTRGIFASGYNSPVFPATGNNTDRIEYITTATTGNALDFGNLDSAIRYASCAANSTRGLIAGGYTPNYIDRIEYITIASLGDAQTFGTLTAGGTATDKAGLSSPTRALFAGGEGPSMVSQIDYVTIATLGDAADFGDLTAARRRAASASSGTRGLVAAGYNGSAYVNTIDYVTIASLGNAQDFGDVTQSRSSSKGQTCSTIRGVFGSGKTPSVTNTVDYVTIATTGNANDFGDTNSPGEEQAGCSDSHGGIS